VFVYIGSQYCHNRVSQRSYTPIYIRLSTTGRMFTWRIGKHVRDYIIQRVDGIRPRSGNKRRALLSTTRKWYWSNLSDSRSRWSVAVTWPCFVRCQSPSVLTSSRVAEGDVFTVGGGGYTQAVGCVTHPRGHVY